MSATQIITDRFIIKDSENDLLGRGGMGNVYRAIDTHSGEIVAIKVLNPDAVIRDSVTLERFVREGEALRKLNHPNIVKLIAAVEQEGQHYLVIEYVGSGSLKDALAIQAQLPVERVVEIALDLADALTRAHRLGIIHRDLKPSNILLTEDDTPRLTDFGIAYLAGTPHLTKTGILVGTVDYLSPEVCQGEPPDERADIWSFGILLFEILAGQLPFKGDNLTTKLTAILTQPVPDLSKLAPVVPDALTDLIYRMLEKDSQQRIPSVRLVGAELEAILKGLQGTLSHPMPGESRFTTPTPQRTAATPPYSYPEYQPAQAAPAPVLQDLAQPYQGQRSRIPAWSWLFVLLVFLFIVVVGVGRIFITNALFGSKTETSNTINAQVQLTSTAIAILPAAATTLPPGSTQSLTATNQARITPVENSASITLQATAIEASPNQFEPTGTTPNNKPQREILLFGPEKGSWEHKADTETQLLSTRLNETNFTAQVTFITPYTTAIGIWDAGFVFRGIGKNDGYGLIIRGNQT